MFLKFDAAQGYVSASCGPVGKHCQYKSRGNPRFTSCSTVRCSSSSSLTPSLSALLQYASNPPHALSLPKLTTFLNPGSIIQVPSRNHGTQHNHQGKHQASSTSKHLPAPAAFVASPAAFAFHAQSILAVESREEDQSSDYCHSIVTSILISIKPSSQDVSQDFHRLGRRGACHGGGCRRCAHAAPDSLGLSHLGSRVQE